jgi:D-galactose 1-dehydrogenase
MTHSPIRIAIIGYGKIAIDSHIPAILANPDFELAAVVSARGAGPVGVPVFRTMAELLTSDVAIDAASHCNTPRARLSTALATIGWPLHTMLEKPPAATWTEWQMLADLSAQHPVTVKTAWHSRANAAVEAAADWLADKDTRRVHIQWHENVRKWHPGQDWIWEPGGFGVFDPGINALSIATAILPFTPIVRAARLRFPANRAMPIAADVEFGSLCKNRAMTASFDWDVSGDEDWRISVDTDAGALELSEGGRCLTIDGIEQLHHDNDEYPTLYRQFAAAIRAGNQLIDAAPLRLVADAFLLGQRETVAAFA